MQRTMENFLRALRAVDVRVSAAEAIDAHRAAATVGYRDRELFRDALCITLAKTADEVGRFDRCFDAFFDREEFRGLAAPDAEDDGPVDASMAEDSPLARMLLENDVAGLAQSMEAAAERAGAANIRLSSQRRLIARRLLDEMGLRGLEQLITNAQQRGDAAAAALAERLARRRAGLFDEANRYVERQHDLYAGESGRKLREELLSQEKLTAVDPREMATMQTLVRRMAKRLAARYSRRQRRARRGQLDVRSTLRRSMPHEGIPFDLVWKRRTLDRPKIVALCDVSGSVANVSHFLLLFLFSLNEVVERLDAFAFSNRLVAVGDILDEGTVEVAIAAVIKRIGLRSTDYGQAFEDFTALHLDKLDRHTTVIILGDGRTNYVDPRVDLLRAINERSRAVIWLNPEPESFWSRGDAEMERYRRFCHVVKTCNTLGQLERIIDDVLRTYLPK
jgi:uncharacterized protein with von Willebrand factor type A (vWA) domain